MFKSLTLAVQLCLNLPGSGSCDQACAKVTPFLSTSDNMAVCWPLEDIVTWLCFHGSPGEQYKDRAQGPENPQLDVVLGELTWGMQQPGRGGPVLPWEGGRGELGQRGRHKICCLCALSDRKRVRFNPSRSPQLPRLQHLEFPVQFWGVSQNGSCNEWIKIICTLQRQSGRTRRLLVLPLQQAVCNLLNLASSKHGWI